MEWFLEKSLDIGTFTRNPVIYKDAAQKYKKKKLNLSQNYLKKIIPGHDLAPPDVQICSSPPSQHFARDATAQDTEGSGGSNSEGKPETGGWGDSVMTSHHMIWYVIREGATL